MESKPSTIRVVPVDPIRFDKIFGGEVIHFNVMDRMAVGQTFTFHDTKNNRHVYATVKTYITSRTTKVSTFKSTIEHYYIFSLTGMINLDGVDMPFSTSINTEVYSRNPIIPLDNLPPVYLIDQNGEVLKKYTFETLDTINNQVVVVAS